MKKSSQNTYYQSKGIGEILRGWPFSQISGAAKRRGPIGTFGAGALALTWLRFYIHHSPPLFWFKKIKGGRLLCNIETTSVLLSSVLPNFLSLDGI